MNCPSCGQENPESAVRCGNCRAPLHNFSDGLFYTIDFVGMAIVPRLRSLCFIFFAMLDG
jgi:hypothetical protein